MIIILTNQSLDLIPNHLEVKIINEPVLLIDDLHLSYNNEIMEFDYLVAYDESFILDNNLPFVKDGNIIITNWVGQTSIENIYIGNFEKAIDDLLNN